ncbi:hypothetical protein LSP04_20940 [Levilactobacillus spicheri]|uniref:Transposase n=1 Tax=Levilactobacillus spicheri TaxID=216463 RepID=A0ABQ0WVB8_9LACO|nr:hypothetical protein LSP04_20940 [Levilactobacillus spicheri]
MNRFSRGERTETGLDMILTSKRYWRLTMLIILPGKCEYNQAETLTTLRRIGKGNLKT